MGRLEKVNELYVQHERWQGVGRSCSTCEVLEQRRRFGRRYQTTWAFVLEEPRPGQTRLIVRGRVASGYRPYGLPQWIAILLGGPAHFIMQRKQLLNIRERVESHGQS
jgi:hypothetical protein